MRRRFAALTAILGVASLTLWGASQANATGCHIRVGTYAATPYVAPTYHATTYHAPVVAQFVPVAVPVYSAQYVPQPTTDPAVIELLRQIGNRLGSLENQRQNPPAPAPQPFVPPPSVGTSQPRQASAPMPPADPAPAQVPAQAQTGNLQAAMNQIAQAHGCLKCHGTGGQGGLSLLESGKFISPDRLTPAQRLAFVQRVTGVQGPDTLMPPPGKGHPPLSEDEVNASMAWVLGAK